MPDNTEITAAKKWCNEARQILGLGTFSSKGKSLSSSASKVAKELVNLQKAVKKGKTTLGDEAVASYTQEFSEIAAALKAAANAADNEEVDRQAHRLATLKEELAVHLATGKKSKAKAEKKLDDEQAASFPGELAAAEKLVTALSQHPLAAAIGDEMTALNGKIDTAKTHNGKKEFGAAIDLLKTVPADVELAKTAADNAQAKKAEYERDLPDCEAKIKRRENHLAFPLLKDAVKDANTKLLAAKAAAAANDFVTAAALLVQIDTACNAMRPTAITITQQDQAYQARYTTVFDRVQRRKGHPEHPAISTQIGQMDTGLAKARSEAAKLAFPAAMIELDKVDQLCAATIGPIDNAVLWRGKYERDLPIVEAKLGRRKKHHDANLIQTDIGQAEQKLAAAAGKGTAHLWQDAYALLIAASDILNEAWTKLVKAPYPDELAGVEAHLQRLKKHAYSDDIKEKIEAIETKLSDAKVQFGRGEHSAARNLVLAAMGLCPVAEGLADTAAYTDKLTKVEDLIEDLTTRNTKGVIDGRLEAIVGRMDEIVKLATASQHAIAVVLLARVNGDCVAAKALLDKQDANAGEQSTAKEVVAVMDDAPAEGVKAVGALVAKLTKHAQRKFIKDDIDAIVAMMKTAQQQAKTEVETAKTTLNQAVEKCGEANLLADRHDEYVFMHDVAEDLVKQLEKHDKSGEISDLIAKVKKGITDAEAKVGTRDHPAARKLLRAASDLAQEAVAQAEFRKKLGVATVTAESLQELLLQPGGAKALDTVIKSLPANTPRKVIEAALEARFGTKVDQFKTQKDSANKELERKDWTEANPDRPGKDAKRIYELLQLVPDSHVRDNEKLNRIIRFTKDRGGAAYGGGIVFMNCGRASDAPSYDVGDKAELLGGNKIVLEDGTELPMDPDCVPADNSKAVYFDWATLHEVGHAVDDKNGVMKGKASTADYGGWEEYGNTPTKVAEAVCKHFNFDTAAGQAYAMALLKGNNNPPSPDDPADWKAGTADLPDWHGRRDKVKAWVTAINGENLWWNGGECQKRAIGNRVYQKAYGSEWNSYLLAARAKGIAGYQFRSPAEWFAELYAAYHLKRLKDSHPAVDWLKAL